MVICEPRDKCVYPSGPSPPHLLCVYLQSRADLAQLSQLHLDRQLIQSWRRLTGDCILSNSTTTNSIIFSMLVFVSPSHHFLFPQPAHPHTPPHRRAYIINIDIHDDTQKKSPSSVFPSPHYKAIHYFEEALGLNVFFWSSNGRFSGLHFFFSWGFLATSCVWFKDTELRLRGSFLNKISKIIEAVDAVLLYKVKQWLKIHFKSLKIK